ncbi:FAD-dependent oxidoreductase [Methylocucumis oryzae]|uniref:FAD-dependent oxidoreductase n=1 Tax=Methylocucumis oryzae TaxID=1632867 RepID=A0A0F3IJ17_9GAMM|nr:FAD-dependent oxidoreductase [Methylocucumis oryzae]KJV06750.1 hypothetical protein VZ94_09340 [Methylocucumis oryzae]
MARDKTIHCDVAVVGAGAAGIAAAVAAAEAGAEVVLIERYGFVGGLATAAMVGTVCGLFYRSQHQARYAVQGFARDFAEAVQAGSQTRVTTFAQGLHFLPYCPTVFQQQALQRLKAAQVRLCLHSVLTGAMAQQQKIQCLSAQTRGLGYAIQPKAVIDCTGNAQVSLLLGLERIEEATYQAGALVFRVSGLPELAPETLSLNLIRWLKQAIDNGDLPPESERLSIIPGTVNKGSALFKLGMAWQFQDSLQCLTDYEIEARSLALVIVEHLSRQQPLLAKLSIIAMASEVGLRSGARPQGLAVLTQDQVLSCAKPSDGVAIGAWPIEYWGQARKPELRYFAYDECYWISAGMLVSRDIDNLFFAGRGLSATEWAMASARVIGTCLNTGYAAGGLASAYALTANWQMAIKRIQQQHGIKTTST